MLRKIQAGILTIGLIGVLIIFCNSRFAFAQNKYDIKTMTPAVSRALENRHDRFEKLKEIKQKGIIGENNKGYVALLINDPDAQRIVEAENHDRLIIYQTIAEQNDLEGSLITIEKVFAQVQREKAESREMFQEEDDSWAAKP